MNVRLQIQGLQKRYEGPMGLVSALDGVDLEINAGEFVMVQGASGSGKTTLLLTAGGLLQPSAGTVAVSGQDLYTLSPAQRARFRAEHIGFVFQQFHLIPYLHVLDNVLTACLGRQRADAATRAEELIARFGLQSRRFHLPSELSTGERQRTALARALLHSPGLLLADEPTGNLDQENARTVLQYLSEFAAAGGAVLLVTHDTAAGAFSQRTLRLAGGRFPSHST